jgi:hypothetical protein
MYPDLLYPDEHPPIKKKKYRMRYNGQKRNAMTA